MLGSFDTIVQMLRNSENANVSREVVGFAIVDVRFHILFENVLKFCFMLLSRLHLLFAEIQA